MAAREYVRTLTVRSREEGAAQVARSLHAVADAQQRVVRTTQEGANVVDMTANRLASAERGWNSLTSRLEGNTSAYRNFIRESNAAKQALDAGLTSVDRYKDVIRQLREELQAAGTSRFGFAVDQSGVNELLGVRTKLNSSARDSAAVFEEEARLMDALQLKASRLRAELDPLGAAYERLNAEIASHQQLADRQMISQDELAQATARSRKAFDDAAASLKPVNDNARLTASQIQNLGFQLNDATTMLLSGASPFQVLATQGGQVIQALQENGGIMSSLRALGTAALEAGVKGTTGLTAMATAAQAAAAAGTAAATSFTFSGAIAGIASLVRMINPAVAAIGAMATASAYLWWKARDATGGAEKAAESYRTTIEAVKRSYGELGAAIDSALEKQLRGSANLSSARIAGSIAIQRASLQSGVDSLRDIDGFSPSTSTLGGFRTLLNMTDPAIASMQEFYGEVVRGQRTVAELQESVARIRIDPTTSDEAKKIADEILKLSENARLAEANIAALERAALELKGVRLAEFSKQLDEFIPDAKRPADRINEIADAALQQARSMGEVYEIERKRKAGLDELTRVEDHRRAGYELDVRAITARSAAERGQIEYERAYGAAINDNLGPIEAARRAEEARTLTVTQANHAYTEAMNDRIRAGQAQVDQLQLEIDTFGKSAGEIARLRAETDMLRAARDAARQAGGIVDPAEEAAIRDQAAAIGELTDRMARLNLGRDQEESMRRLQAEAGLIHLNADARRVAIAGLEAESELRRQGIPLNDAWGQTYVQNARDMASMEVALDKQTEAFEGLRDAAGDFFSSLSSGKGILESFVGAFAKLGNDLAAKGFDKIFGGLFGASGQGGGANAGQIVGAIGQALSTPQRPSLVDQTYAAPLGRVDRAPLGPVTVSLPTTASTTVARAGNAFLDLIRRAEGTAGANGYNTSLAYGRFTGGERNLTGMTLNQIDALQTAMLRHPGNTYNSSALGAYQIVRTTLRSLREELGLSGSQMYSPELQDRLALTLARRRGASVSGLRNEWEGFRRVGSEEILGAYRSGVVRSAETAFRAYEGTPIKSDSIVAVSKREAERVFENGAAKGITRAVEGYSSGRFDSSSSGAAGGLFGPRGQAGLSVLGAGLGAFGSGYQSGSPLSGGLSGALGGYQAGGAISSFLGIGAGAGAALGVVGGAALGILGGILGARKQRAEAHKRAAEQWEQIRPQYEAFDKSLSPDGTGQIREWLTSTWSQLSSFMKVGGAAWKNGTGNSTAQFASTGTKMFDRFNEMLVEFRDGFDAMIEDLSSGEGLAGAFAKGRAATKDLQKQIDGMIDDVSIAFGSDDIGIPVAGFYTEASKQWEEARNKAIEQAKKAAGEYSLSLLYTAEVNSDVEKTLDGFRGTAAGLQKVLEKLGWTADQAAADIEDRLTQAIGKMAETFTEGFQAQINDLSGVGYFNDVADLLKARDTALSDAALLGVDPAIVTDWFKLAAQDIVNGAELTGSALDALVAKFPELAGVVKSFTEAATVTTQQVEANYRSFLESRLSELTSARADAESKLLSAYQRTVDWVKSLPDFVANMNLSDTSPLGGREKADQARQTFLDLAAKAANGDVEAQEKLLDSSQDLLDASRDYYVSSEAYFADFKLVQETLKATEAKTTSQLDQMRSQASFLSAINDNTKSLTTLMSEWIEADKAEKALQKQLDGNRTFGANPERNRLIDAGIRQLGLNYTGNYGFQADGSDPFRAWRESLPAAQLAAVIGVIQQYIGINRQMGGLIPGYAAGGIVGNGIWNKDSVLARYAGGGTIGLAGGEMVISAPKVTPQTYPVLDAINRTGRVPGGNDNRDLVAALVRVENLLRLQVQTTGQGLSENTAAVRSGNRSSEQMALASRRQSAKAA